MHGDIEIFMITQVIKELYFPKSEVFYHKPRDTINKIIYPYISFGKLCLLVFLICFYLINLSLKKQKNSLF